jgi:ferredoxin-NADP reductase/predicted pyridoxine 5'-phosphate oxidase superfamily flavin-nucleotide-binding protein
MTNLTTSKIDESAVPDESPFHEGERRIQRALGVREEMEVWGRRVIRPYLPEQHTQFYAELPFVVAAARDSRGRPWATLLASEPGFAKARDPRTLEVAARPARGDALGDALFEGADVGLLGIELHTRRRNRLNGRISRANETGITLRVDQSFGNCPQHIHVREVRSAAVGPQPARPRRQESLSDAQLRWVARADTFFIASGHRGQARAAHGMDASHRGGPPGFVVCESERELAFPDYTGNNHFNTLGNLLLDPRVGLLFLDFQGGGLLQITGQAEIEWHVRDEERFPGAKRLVRVQIEEVVEQKRALPIRFIDPASGTRPLLVLERRIESDDVTSFLLCAPSGERLPDWRPGQHLPLHLENAATGEQLVRTYSLSGDPDGDHYRISVKREPKGRVSRLLHDETPEGSILRAGAPEGDFHLSPETLPAERHVVLVGAGIGITPLASMAFALARRRPEGRFTLVHGVRDGAHHPLSGELRALVTKAPGGALHVRYSAPREEDREAQAFDSEGRVDVGLLGDLVDFEGDVSFHLCGPVAFMGEIQAGLEARGVPSETIHFETF